MKLLLVVATVISAFLFLSLFFFQATRKTYPGFAVGRREWAFLPWFTFSFPQGNDTRRCLYTCAETWPFPLGMVMHLDGMRRFLGLSAPSKLWYYCMPHVVLAVCWFSTINGTRPSAKCDRFYRATAPHWAMAALIFRQPAKRRSMFFTVVGSFLVIAGATDRRTSTGRSLSRGSYSYRFPVQIRFFIR